jgi:hypothetical protein
MISNELEFVAEEWARLAVDKAVPLGLPASLLGREFVVQGMCMLTGRSAEDVRRTINEEMTRFRIVTSD